MKRKSAFLKLTALFLTAFLFVGLCAACTVTQKPTEPATDATGGASTDATSGASTDATGGASEKPTDPVTDATSGASETPTQEKTEESASTPTQEQTDPATEGPTVENDLIGCGKSAYNHGVLGEGKGINPGRVVWAYKPGVFTWNGMGYWWATSHFDVPSIEKMWYDSLLSLTNTQTEADAWDALFRYKDIERGVAEGYKPGDGVVIKVNMNGSNASNGRTNILFTSPVMLKVLLESLVRAGVRPEDITVFDCTRVIPDPMIRYCDDGIAKGVKYRYNDGGGANDCTASADPIKWSKEFAGEDSYFPDFVVNAKYFINASSMKGHALAGVTVTAKNLFGSLINSSRSSAPGAAGLHELVDDSGWTKGRTMAVYNPLVDLMANADAGAKTILYISESFISTPTQNTEVNRDMKWDMAPFNGDWPSSIFISQDPVALDSVCVDFLTSEPSIIAANEVNYNTTTLQNYLHEAALVPAPPSATLYTDGHGNVLTQSLGVHEHWNNDVDKEYSRNLGKSEGIELYRIFYN